MTPEEQAAIKTLLDTVPQVNLIFGAPATHPIPETTVAQCYILARLASHTTVDTFTAGLNYAERFPFELQVFYVKMVVTVCDKSLLVSELYQSWLLKHSKVILSTRPFLTLP